MHFLIKNIGINDEKVYKKIDKYLKLVQSCMTEKMFYYYIYVYETFMMKKGAHNKKRLVCNFYFKFNSVFSRICQWYFLLTL